MRYVLVEEVLKLHDRVIRQTGGGSGVRDRSGLESAVAQPQMTFDGRDVYPTLAAKAAALGFSLARNHPFVDGNKRTAHAVMEVFLVLNGFEIKASVAEQEALMLALAEGTLRREAFVEWLERHIEPRSM